MREHIDRFTSWCVACGQEPRMHQLLIYLHTNEPEALPLAGRIWDQLTAEQARQARLETTPPPPTSPQSPAAATPAANGPA